MNEPLDAQRRPLVIGTLVVLLGTAVGTAVAVLLLLQGRPQLRLSRNASWYREVPVEVNEVEAQTFSAPTAAELQQREARRRLTSYQWVDRAQGIAAVPLEVAIDSYLRQRSP